MDLHVDDDGFVRAPVGLVYARLTDVGGWERWWPGASVRPLAAGDGDERFALTLSDRRLRRRLRLTFEPHSWSHDDRFACTLSGDLEGSGEFWLESGWGGTVVHHWLAATAPRRPLGALATYRRALRRGLWGFKDLLQGEVRTTHGRPA